MSGGIEMSVLEGDNERSVEGPGCELELPIDSGIALSIRIDNLRCLSIKRYQLRVLSTNY